MRKIIKKILEILSIFHYYIRGSIFDNSEFEERLKNYECHWIKGRKMCWV